MIKFRVWDKENEIYLYNVQDAYDMLSGFVKYDDGENASYEECCFGDFLDNERYDVEQFAGLKDVNGKDIYEGDILHSTKHSTSSLPHLRMWNIGSSIIRTSLPERGLMVTQWRKINEN